MRLHSTNRSRTVATALAAAAAAGAASGALVAQGASGGSLPANPPTDASAAKLTVINRTVTPAPTSNRGFDGFQTYTVNAPAGKTVLQGFATLSGGQTGSVVILSTQATPAKYVVKLKFPGEQGRPGKLHVRVQLLPKE
jgi:hypothetical protein